MLAKHRGLHQQAGAEWTKRNFTPPDLDRKLFNAVSVS
jgi:hypothetical protein